MSRQRTFVVLLLLLLVIPFGCACSGSQANNYEVARVEGETATGAVELKIEPPAEDPTLKQIEFQTTTVNDAGFDTVVGPIPEPQIIYSVLWVLEQKFYDPTKIDYAKLLNVGLESIHGIGPGFEFIPNGSDKDAAWAHFVREWNKINHEYDPEHKQEHNVCYNMLESCEDSHTNFREPKFTKSFLADMTRESFGGIGIVMMQDNDGVMVAEVLPNTPASASGIKKLDRIIDVNGQRVIDMNDAHSRIRGTEGTKVILGLKRKNETLELELTRARIQPPTFTSEVLTIGDKRIYYLKLWAFNDIFAYSAIQRDYIANYPVDAMIVDVRGNGGGYLDLCDDLMSAFLPKGTPTYQLVGREGIDNRRTENRQAYKKPVVVLVNGGSGSASEIFSAVLQENGRAKVIGGTSAGAVSVAMPILLPRDCMMMVTVKSFFTAAGKKLEGVGVIPDFPVEITQEDVLAGRDPQLDKAIEVLMQGFGEADVRHEQLLDRIYEKLVPVTK